jgi:AcrR family transcriptional regulator
VNSREDILNASIELFSKRGFDGVTIRDVSGAANVGTPTIYYFFGDKRNLHNAALIEAYRRISGEIPDAAAADENPKQQLAWYIEHQLELYERENAPFRLFLRDVLDDDSKVKKQVADDTLAPHVVFLSSILRRINPNGATHVMVRIILSVLAGFSEIRTFDPFLSINSEAKIDGAMERRRIATALAEFAAQRIRRTK